MAPVPGQEDHDVMALRFTRRTGPPIALDLGSACTRMLQRSTDDPSRVAAAAECPHASTTFDLASYLDRAQAWIRQTLDSSVFTGRSVSVCMPAQVVSMQHLKLECGEDEALALQTRLGDAGDEAMTRSIDITDPSASSHGGRDLLCLSMPRTAVMRTVQVFHDLGLEVQGLYTPASMLIKAFSHLNRRGTDRDVATMYVDLDSEITTMAMGHGPSIVLARSIACTISGSIAAAAPASKVEAAVACGGSRAGDTIERRTGEAPSSQPDLEHGHDCGIDRVTGDLVEELHMSLRSHAGLFNEVPVKRLVFTGDGAHNTDACRHVARSLNLPAQVGDPLARWDSTGTECSMGGWSERVRPCWTRAAGLASLMDEDSDT